MLEDPLFRRRALGVAAVSAILIAGAAGIDHINAANDAAPRVSAATIAFAEPSPPQYFDDVTRDWSAPAPRRVELVSVHDASLQAQAVAPTGSAEEGAALGDGLDGGPLAAVTPQGAATQTSYAQAAPAGAPDIGAAHTAATQSFQHIEAQIRQADRQQQPDASDANLKTPD
jgi:hypothetical protein